MVLTSIALSITTLILGGVILNETFGISRASVTSLAAGVSIVATAVGVVWRVRSSRAVLPRRQQVLRVSVGELLVFALAASLVVAAIAYARTPRAAPGVEESAFCGSSRPAGAFTSASSLRSSGLRSAGCSRRPPPHPALADQPEARPTLGRGAGSDRGGVRSRQFSTSRTVARGPSTAKSARSSDAG